MASFYKNVRIVGVGKTEVGKLQGTTGSLAVQALSNALTNAKMNPENIDALIAVPSLAYPHLMHAHYIATVSSLIQINRKMIVHTLDTGGASPVSALATAMNYIRNEWARTVAIVSSDAILSLSNEEFKARSDATIADEALKSPHVVHGYDFYAQWHMKEYGTTREQLAMVPVLMSSMASRHPDAMCKKNYTLDEVLKSRQIAPVTNLLECARKADGAAAIIVSSEAHYEEKIATGKLDSSKPLILGVGEASGPLYPPSADRISPDIFSCRRAAGLAYRSATLDVSDIGFFSLFDCFPICFIMALEAVGLCPTGGGGKYVEKAYEGMMKNNGIVDPNLFPINTHGGLLCYGAPWSVPAMYGIIEAVSQLSGGAKDRQISPTPKRALVYGNGGIFSSSAIAILCGGARESL